MGAADKPTDAALLAAVGVSMFGDTWPAPMARLLKVNERTLQRVRAAVQAGEGYPLAPGVLKDLAAALRHRADLHLGDAALLDAAARDAEAR